MYEIFNQSLYLKKARSYYLKKQTIHPLLDKAATTIAERISWSKKEYKNTLILGPYSQILEEHIKKQCPNLLNEDTKIQYKNIVFESERLPFNKNTFDCVFSFFDLQFLNDVPGHLKQIEYTLKEDGLFIGVFLGNGSFLSLKKYVLEKELTLNNGASLRFYPTISIENSAHLLSRAGFDCPLVDYNRYELEETPMNYILQCRDLHSTGLLKKQMTLSKKLAFILLDERGKIKTYVDFIFMTGLGKRVSFAQKLEQTDKGKSILFEKSAINSKIIFAKSYR